MGGPAPDPAMVRKVADLLRDAATVHILPEFAGRGRTLASEKSGGGLITQVDTAVQSAIREGLTQAYPGSAFLGEEMAPEDHRRALDRPESELWCLDPLDGTSNFAAGVPIFGVSLALLRDGQPVLGAVLDPLRDELFTALRGQGAWLNGYPISVDSSRDLRRSVAVIDFKRLAPELARGLAWEQPFHCQRSFGASVLEWCWLACGRVDFYLHGGQNLWDFAAGSLIAAEAGADVATLEGEPLFAGDILRRSVLAVAHEPLRRELAPYLAGSGGGGGPGS